MGLVLVKEVTCNLCNETTLPANELESHRRWDCDWTKVEATGSDKAVTRRPDLLGPSQDFDKFKKEVQFTSML